MKTIIIADGYSTVRKTISTVFAEDMGYTVIPVSNGKDAVSKAKEIMPDIILADVGLPEKDGYKVSEEIKSNPLTQNIPVILLASSFGSIDETKAAQSGADDFTLKLFDPEELRKKVDFHIGYKNAIQKRQSARLPIIPKKKRRENIVRGGIFVFAFLFIIPAFIYLSDTFSAPADISQIKSEKIETPKTSLSVVTDDEYKDLISENHKNKESLETRLVKVLTATKPPKDVNKVKEPLSKKTGKNTSFKVEKFSSGKLDKSSVKIKQFPSAKRYKTSPVKKIKSPKIVYRTKRSRVREDITGSSYVVRKGDTLGKIAERADTTVRNIVKANSIGSKRIYVGDTITITKEGQRVSAIPKNPSSKRQEYHFKAEISRFDNQADVNLKLHNSNRNILGPENPNIRGAKPLHER